MSRRSYYRSVRKQKGLALVLVTAAMLSLIGVAALSIDVNHAMLNKTRLQNSLDAAALAAAIVIDNGGTTAQATAAANTTLTNMTNATGNDEMDFSSSSVSVQYSNDPTVFPDGSFNLAEDTFVRVSVSNYELDNFLAHVLNADKNLDSSAVAGPSPSVGSTTNIVPIAVCEGDDGGTNGYNLGQIYPIKVADHHSSDMGPGNYQLLDFGSGASTIREALAGDPDPIEQYQQTHGSIGVGGTVTTKPGNTVGPVGQGLNTRFGSYSGGGVTADDYPSDVYVREPDTSPTTDNDGNVTYDDTSGAGGQPWGYSDYKSALPDCTGDSDCRIASGGQINRRTLVLPVVDCSGATGGSTSFEVTALACFFLLQQAPTSNGSKDPVYGEFIEDCSVLSGPPGQNSDSDGPYRIVLYKDPNGDES
ncbi:Tad domain-containing protein [Vibrio europaeus]|uniref:Tad domain-containing protein n=1 Tax=Vibrio europaeus TaxID=300876 RepID=UPI00233E7BA2|nr:Tad domain-containing protein [Vibrio europaeus]MDC5823068.1 Tad domain-containing protein [Vibrio europaeus]MDC5869697.1 Tad domain-containing protein [Vibrio europaeus]